MIGRASLPIRYIGVMALLGKTIRYADDMPRDERAMVDQAFKDANAWLEKERMGVRFLKASGGGYASFEHAEPDPVSEKGISPQ